MTAAAHEQICVPASRLAWGTYDHDKQREIGEGDISRAYSADRIGEGKPARQPFEWGGNLWVTISISGKGLTISGEHEFQAYRIVPPAIFNGVATTYREKVYDGSDGENARNDPLGFYHGMKIVCGGKPFIMRGPPAVFVAEDPDRPATPDPSATQMSLFT